MGKKTHRLFLGDGKRCEHWIKENKKKTEKRGREWKEKTTNLL